MTAIRRSDGVERQDPVIDDEDHRSSSQLETDLRLVGGQLGQLHLRRFVVVRAFEQAQPELHPKDPADCLVEELHVHQPGVEGGPERAGIGGQPRELEVHTGLEGHRRHDCRVVGQVVGGLEHLDARVIGNDDAVEPPEVAQDRPQ